MEDKRLDGVIRIKKARNFVVMDKTFIEDKRLSFKAKGIMTYLLSRPDNWQVIVRDIVEQSTDGKSAVYSALKELEECGYYKKVPIRNEQGNRILRWESTVYEVPEEAEVLINTEVQKDIKTKGTRKVKKMECAKVNTPKDELNSAKDELNSLHSDFKEQESEHIENREHNKYINKINNNLNNNYQSCQTEPDFETTLSVVQENIRYDDLEISHAKDMPLINEFVSIMVDAILSKGKMVRIGGEEKPRELVKSVLMKLNYYHLEHVLDKFKSYDKRIKKKRQYILSMLYHASMELEAGLTNEFCTEWGYA